MPFPLHDILKFTGVLYCMLISFQLNAQIGTYPEQDRCGAFNICTYQIDMRGGYKGYGNIKESQYENYDYWMKFKVAGSGKIQMVATQQEPNDSYNYKVYKFNGSNCSDGSSYTLIRSGSTQNGVMYMVDNGYNNNAIQVSPDEEYYINITGTGSGSTFPPAGPVHYVPTEGVHFDFSSSTAMFLTGNPPVMDSIENTCINKSKLILHVSKLVKCSSIASDGSDFYISPALPNNNKVTVAKGKNCTQYPDGFTNEISLWFQNNVSTSGVFQLQSKMGNDGNTLVDMCNQEMPIPNYTTFIIPELETIENKVICTQQMPYDWHGNIVNETGDSVAVYNYYNNDSCPSSIYLNLTTTDTLRDTVDVFICSYQMPYNWNGSGVNNTGNNAATYSTSTEGGCDSITTLNLHIISPTTDSIVVSNCGSAYYHLNTYYQDTLLKDTLASVNGCDSIYQIVKIKVYPAIIPQTINNDTMGCGFVVFNGQTYVENTIKIDTILNINGCDSIYTKWNITVYPNTQPVQKIDTIIGCKGLDYHGTVFNKDTIINEYLLNQIGCDSFLQTTYIFIKDFNLTISANPAFPVKGDIVQLYTSSNLTKYQVLQWQPSNLFENTTLYNQVIKINEPELITVLAETDYGCKDTAQISITADSLIPNVMIPSAFSPNNDGINDVFAPVFANNSGYIIHSFVIYNKYGQLIYSSNQRNNMGWNGKYGNIGEPLPIGVYYYRLDVTYINGKHDIVKGDVTLLK